MSESMQGSCLCGKVSYQVSGPFDTFHLCHCSQCRKSTGTAHAANIFARAENIEWLSGEDQIKRYTPEREGVISKCFCSHCGSLVPYVSLQSGRLVIPAGSLDSESAIHPVDNIFWADRADWYDAGVNSEKCDQDPQPFLKKPQQ